MFNFHLEDWVYDYDDEDDDDEEIGVNESTIQYQKKPSAASTPQQRRDNVGSTPATNTNRYDDQQQQQRIEVSEAPQVAPLYSGPKFGTMDINGEETHGGEDGGQKERQPFRGPRQYNNRPPREERPPRQEADPNSNYKLFYERD